jgi:hypothetical protein
VHGAFATDEASTITYAPDAVTLDGNGAYGIRDLWIRSEDTDPSPLAFPKVGRNAPCPCGSGLKSKRCHGRSERGFSMGT